MTRRRRRAVEPAPRPDLTPMIDVTFLLVIFFMVAAELSTSDTEQLELPYAEVEEPRPTAEEVLHVNVLADGRVKVRGLACATAARAEPAALPLADLLALEALDAEREAAEGGGAPRSRLRVNVRADQAAGSAASSPSWTRRCAKGSIAPAWGPRPTARSPRGRIGTSSREVCPWPRRLSSFAPFRSPSSAERRRRRPTPRSTGGPAPTSSS